MGVEQEGGANVNMGSTGDVGVGDIAGRDQVSGNAGSVGIGMPAQNVNVSVPPPSQIHLDILRLQLAVSGMEARLNDSIARIREQIAGDGFGKHGLVTEMESMIKNQRWILVGLIVIVIAFFVLWGKLESVGAKLTERIDAIEQRLSATPMP